MKTVEVVTMAKGWYVTRKYLTQNKGSQFFPFGTKKSERKASEKAKDEYIKNWVGE